MFGKGKSAPLGNGHTKRDEKPQLEDVQEENIKLKARLSELETLPAQLRDLRATLEEEMTTATSKWKADEEALRTRIILAEADAQKAATRATELERTAAKASQERREALALLDARSAALREAESFLTKTDDIPDAEVVHLAERMNAQIAKLAEAVAASPAFAFTWARGTDQEAEGAVSSLKRGEWVGLQLVGKLQAASNDGRRAVLKVALQGGIVAYVQWLASSWDFDTLEPGGLLQSLYVQIRARGAIQCIFRTYVTHTLYSEPQSVAGRWRALARTHVKALLETGEAQTQRLFDTLTGIITDVLVVGGAHGTRADVSACVAREFEAALYDVVSLALEFQWTTGERILTRDFVLCAVEAGSEFSWTGMELEKTGSLDTVSAGRGCVVAATVALGVRMERKVGGEKDVPGDVRKTMVLKPKVLLL